MRKLKRLLTLLLPTTVFAEGAVVGPGPNIPDYKVIAIESAQSVWNEYAQMTEYPQISDDYSGKEISNHCLVTLTKDTEAELPASIVKTIVSRGCDRLKIDGIYRAHIYDICSEWRRDFYSYLNLKGALFEIE
jgi:hypothetical protein